MLKCDAEELKMTAEQFKEHKQKLRRTVDLLRRSQKRRACAPLLGIINHWFLKACDTRL